MYTSEPDAAIFSVFSITSFGSWKVREKRACEMIRGWGWVRGYGLGELVLSSFGRLRAHRCSALTFFRKVSDQLFFSVGPFIVTVPVGTGSRVYSTATIVDGGKSTWERDTGRVRSWIERPTTMIIAAPSPPHRRRPGMRLPAPRDGEMEGQRRRDARRRRQRSAFNEQGGNAMNPLTQMWMIGKRVRRGFVDDLLLT